MSRPSSLAGRAFHGITAELAGICVLFVALSSLFSFPVATAPARGLDLAQAAEGFAWVFVANLVRIVPAGIGIVVWNLVRAQLGWGIAATIAAIGASAWAALLLSSPIDDAAYAPFFDRSTVEFARWVNACGIAAFVVLVVVLLVRDADGTRALDRQRLQVLDLDRGLAEARLRVTQAQIEPHFLFNTLANVRRLYDLDPISGRAMLRHFTGVLSNALPSMRQLESTLGQEVACATAYLSVQQIRMGRRLSFAFDVPEGLRDVPFPPMMLLTLVENAIKHGLAPLPKGGTIRVEAQREGPALQVRVIDTGRGFDSSTSGTGIGLANIEARLRAAFGNAGRLVLEENPDVGVTATIEVPA